MKTTYLSLGSNLGDKLNNLTQAIQLIHQRIGEVVQISSIYETKAMDFESEDRFNNCCISVKTELSPIQLLYANQRIEKELGRVKTRKNEYESRKIDIDIILYENEVISNEEIIVPHQHFRERNFVLHPLAEIAKDTLDPVTQLTTSQLAVNSKDYSEIIRLNSPIYLK